jgi:hypothetical protein
LRPTVFKLSQDAAASLDLRRNYSARITRSPATTSYHPLVVRPSADPARAVPRSTCLNRCAEVRVTPAMRPNSSRSSSRPTPMQIGDARRLGNAGFNTVTRRGGPSLVASLWAVGRGNPAHRRCCAAPRLSRAATRASVRNRPRRLRRGHPADCARWRGGHLRVLP